MNRHGDRTNQCANGMSPKTYHRQTLFDHLVDAATIVASTIVAPIAKDPCTRNFKCYALVLQLSRYFCPRISMFFRPSLSASGRCALLLLVVAFVVLLLAMQRDLNLFDEGVVLVGAMRVADGQIPHRDFYANPHSPDEPLNCTALTPIQI